ncbi:hypothetical protein [Candidatus Solirubrobacter pratensis]|uniref:hypothetical protein n=1 Tax=Candidatus Solirubrobacter pratensis TaxID=1298857 RepID=UPI0003FDE064|nr:hypothetical protein [Candidatus Solirubrobacter pratensis]
MATTRDEGVIAKAAALDAVRVEAYAYFELRDKLAARKIRWLERMLQAAEDAGATQVEIAEAVAFEPGVSGAGDDWSFHRTRIQQFLTDAKINRQKGIVPDDLPPLPVS